MSVHIAAKKGEIAEKVLLPGDPMRAKFIAETFLGDHICYNEVRGMYGYTGNFRGKRISVQSTGMGIPSCSIYIEELLREYGCKTLIRVGSCGSIQEHIKVRDIILAIGASTDSNCNNLVFKWMNFAPTASFDLLRRAYEHALSGGVPVKVGNVMSSDTFYNVDHDFYQIWKKHGIMAFEMETSALYTLAARYGIESLSILTVSDHILTGESLTAEERAKTFHSMCEIALNTV